MPTTNASSCGEYSAREAADGVLYQVLLEHLETFLARIADDPATPSLPGYVERELRSYLSCGILAGGFCRIHCFACGTDLLLPFSCKGRGFCPSCGGRRMAEAAAHLVDNVLPEVPVRQWVLSFPWRLRYLLALDARLCRAVRKVFLRAVFGFYARAAAEDDIEGGQGGAVNQIQRFGSALNANVHFHALALDGIYTAPDPFTPPVFHPARRITSAQVAALLFTVRSRILRLCRRRGLMRDEGELDTQVEEQGLLPWIQAASIQGRVALGPDAGSRIPRIGRPPVPEAAHALVTKELCASLGGFSLHAAVKIGAGDTPRLEHICRYITRPALSSQRLSINERGQVVLQLRVPFRDGTTHFVFEPLAFIERLAALVPPPRMHQLTYHGVLAPGSSRRSEIVPRRARSRSGSCGESKTVPRPCNRYSWSELMQRVFAVDVLQCTKCGSRRRWIAAITETAVIVKILEHLGLPSVAATPAAARPPPQLELSFEVC